MKVKINKKAEVKEYNVINSWNDVTLDNWLNLVDVDKDLSGSEAYETIKELSDIPKTLIKELSLSDVAAIMQHFTKLQSKAPKTLTNIIKLDDVEYGFHPKLDDLTLGEYADIETMITNGVNNSLPELMAILYRPITEKKNGKYTIEAYDGEITMRAEEMRKMPAQEVQNAMVFFWTFVSNLLMIMPSFLVDGMKQNIEV